LVGQSVTRVSRAKTAEPIEMAFGFGLIWTEGIELDRGLEVPTDVAMAAICGF